VISWVGGGRAVGEQQTLKAEVVGVAHGGVHTDIGRHSAQDQIANVTSAEDQVEVGADERALPRLVDNRLASNRVQFGDRVLSLGATDEQTAKSTLRANLSLGLLRQRLFSGRSERSGM